MFNPPPPLFFPSFFLAGVGPEHAWLKDTGRAEYVMVNDGQALEAMQTLSRTGSICVSSIYVWLYMCVLMRVSRRRW
jgi:tryptophan synthase beta subunit